MSVELYPHQREAVDKMHNGCILLADMGLGKTMVAATYYIEKEAPKDVIVITTAKKRDSLDWDAEFARLGVGTRPGATVAGVLTVDSWNNIGKYTQREGAFFIFDEQRLVGSGAWTRSFYKIAKKNSWILLTATPGDTWIDYIPVFVANGFYKNRSEFLQSHVVYNRFSKFPKVERYVGVSRLLRYRQRLLVEMLLLERHTTRLIEEVPVDYDQDQFERVLKQRWHVYENRPLRDVAELFVVMRKVVNSDASRTRALRGLMRRHPKLIVFYNFDYELLKLREMFSPEFGVENHQSREISDVRSNGHQTPATTPSSESNMETLPSRSTRTASSAEPWSIRKIDSSVATSSTSTTTCTSGPAVLNRPTVAEWNGHKHEPIPDTDSWVYLVQYQAGSEGWNCIETDATVFYSLTYSYKNWYQAFGRIDRLNTPFTILHYYVLMSDSVIDKAIMRSLKGKKSFNEKRFLSRIPTTRSQEKHDL